MHELACHCAKCQGGAAPAFEMFEFPLLQESQDEFSDEALFGETDAERPFDEIDENELAMELLEINSEEELDQFLGKVFKRAWKGIKKVGSVVGKVAGPLSGVLKGIAKTALPFVGGALGSLIPIPGVGTAVGTALGSAVSKALEVELGELEPENQDLEMARRFVRIAGSAAQQAAQNGAMQAPQAAAQAAVLAAARQHLPQLTQATAGNSAAANSGRWVRQGRNIVLLGH